MRVPVKVTAALFAGGVLLALLTAAMPAEAAAISCTDTDLPVTGPGLPPPVPGAPATVHGRPCLPATSGSGTDVPDTVQLLVHGGTYNSAYWDLPYRPERYSYQRDMAAHGYATFAADQLGAGRSSRPLSLLLSVRAAAEAMHEVVGHLRAGHVGGVRFAKVVIVGHSVGSGVVAVEASSYHDVDGVVLTGITHLPVLAVGAALGLQPALLDGQLGRLGSDPLYFTTKPGARAGLFYAAGDSDPAVIAAGEAAKDQVSVPGMGTVAVFGIVLPATKGITAPVFQVVGEKDVLFCGLLALRDCSDAGVLRAQEAPYYADPSNLSMYVLPGAGHSVALHENAAEYRDATRSWLRERVGVTPQGYHSIG
ncbi:alpha/beta hydrolase [Amycolatopsis australiensis]|uniref:Lysophospholipase, alpha-beta hydrolase superfamily n=1 Tax=Amycolatopsis australiensis TaxID=546364 RepID=A0A1K1SHY4_9PSEU|nr:alpha/beta hydrolase [Amycolatopsis australiensis]SFW84008.1 Lysophospholipase, alpha-beta hydrolase superfamily [Amycolatopsis australiensis]